ncbi:1,2-phenylacetyl-CoA epoxidase subunit PaaD [Sphingomicrobium astaxanthinifaciens]|uniref:1,2-phenylacetyl-CoA epoxidase subunit PaaD n=1 Tax=Sphingomicrobium astaxanthinifaciens TaxID=1227949 RepID=UPI001FCB6062|nr:1,2-phenylacetyl-CoA epoxidase subunit PaaD [Sphingomicrobium astaxanthinifaciens]MCJ7421036.1 phenylacetate-CoA oxygenase subunit PaaJ [Sphingomicrobium astaxanthinifaciens]
MDRAAIEAVLAGVPDPEIPVVSVVDLGIVRGIEEDAEGVKVIITPTYSGCPATVAIEESVREALDAHGFREVRIEHRLVPPWSTDMISAAGHDKLKAYGIAPPSRSETVECPQCGSHNTKEISRFGSTPCKAQWQCKDCLEPFDRFKCH